MGWEQCRGLAACDDEAALHAGASTLPAAVMIARGALWNPAIFCRKDGACEPEYDEVVRNYIQTALSVNNCWNNTKWVLREMMNRGYADHDCVSFGGLRGKQLRQLKNCVDNATTISAVCDVFGET